MSQAPDPGSFRDPAGFIFRHRGQLYRQINKKGQSDFRHFIDSGLYRELTGQGLIVAHTTVDQPAVFAPDPKRYLVIKPAVIPFISYPYEWTFSQLKAAAQLTLEIQNRALNYGMILKDASAYNIQFIGKQPVFIDTLSFKQYQDGEPWEGYRQFCEHFLAPLALSVYSSPTILRSSQVFLDGLPLSFAISQLPRRARLRRGLLAHLYLHAAAQKRYQGSHITAPKQSTKRPKVSQMALRGLMASLERTIAGLKIRDAPSQWRDYYSATNYSDSAFKAKRQTVTKMLAQISPRPKIVWDLGANDGTFSQLAANIGAYTVAFDIDPAAVELNFKNQMADKSKLTILPLVQDFTNPSPDLGWAGGERQSLVKRGPADAALALALVHHLAIGHNIPLDSIAAFFAKLANYLIIEFVPKSDSMTQRLLASREDIFGDYSPRGFEAAFTQHFRQLDKQAVRGSQRVIYLYKTK